jgi:hypothetical protein
MTWLTCLLDVDTSKEPLCLDTDMISDKAIGSVLVNFIQWVDLNIVSVSKDCFLAYESISAYNFIYAVVYR